jgi:hypothetical protein
MPVRIWAAWKVALGFFMATNKMLI